MYSMKMRYHVLFLGMAVIRVAMSDTCPARCTCGHLSTEYHVIVNCSYQQRTDVPTDFPTDTEYVMFQGNNISIFTCPSLSKLRKLDIQANHLRTIMADSFRHLPALETLILSDNNIASLDAGAFRGLPALRHLYLERNMIKDLPDAVFSGFKLESLWLTSNRLKSIGSHTFEGCSVVNLNLSGNAIGNPHANAFAPLKASLKRLICNDNRQPLKFGTAAFRGVNLTELSLANSRLNDDTSFLAHVNTIRLDLSGNRLPLSSLNLHNYTSLSNVQYLRLSDMSLTKILTELLPNSSALRVIDLSENNIRAITSESFKYVTQLTTLNMQSNRVQTMNESLRPLLDKIGTFMINGNPLHCNCELRWYHDWLNGPRLNKHGLYTQCLTPSTGYIVKMADSSFVCTVPHIAYVTPNMTKIDEGDDVFLTCSAVADPAPVVKWTSPSGDSISISPSQDRRRTKTAALLRVASISRSQAGLYRCMATNLKGHVQVSVCVGMLIPGSNWTACDGSSTIASTEAPPSSTKTLVTEMAPPSTGTPRASTNILRTELTPPSTGTLRASTASTSDASSNLTGVMSFSTSPSPAPPSPQEVNILAALIIMALIVAILIIAFVYIRKRRSNRSSDISSGLDGERRLEAETEMAGNEMLPLLPNNSQR